MSGPAADWRTIGGTTTAWFDAPSTVRAAELAVRVLEQAPDALLDVRATGVRVRLPDDAPADTVSTAARDLGLAGDPSVLQDPTFVLESPDPAAVAPFWRRVLAYADADDGTGDVVLVDPLHRDPVLRLRRSDEHRPLRDRLHVDVVRPAAAVAAADLGTGGGPYGVRLADVDGNEVDLVPGGPLGEDAATADWHVVFGAVACYRTTSSAQQQGLVTAAARLADAAGVALLVDVRPGLVVLDSGKDQWEDDVHAPDVDVRVLAARLQAAAREHGAVADPALPRLVQVVVDAVDVPTVRGFWRAALGYVPDARDGLTDLVDPRRVGPVLMLQDLDADDDARRRQRTRLHVELAVPADVAPARVDAAVAAGGRVLDAADGRWRVADPEANELVVGAG